MTLSVNSVNEMRLNTFFASAKKGLMLPITWLSQYYSAVLNKEIDTKATLQLLNVQAAFALAVLPAEAPFLFRAICTAWFALAIRADVNDASKTASAGKTRVRSIATERLSTINIGFIGNKTQCKYSTDAFCALV